MDDQKVVLGHCWSFVRPSIQVTAHTHSLTPSKHVVVDTARSKRKKDKNTDDLLCYVCYSIFFFPSPLCNSHSSLTPISEDRDERE